MDTTLLTEWAVRAGLPDPYRPAGSICGWSDWEVAYDVRREDGGWAVYRKIRSSSQYAWFVDETDVERFLLIVFGGLWRSEQGLPDLFPMEYAPGTTVASTGHGLIVDVGDRSVMLPERSSARWFTYVAHMAPAELALVLVS